MVGEVQFFPSHILTRTWSLSKHRHQKSLKQIHNLSGTFPEKAGMCFSYLWDTASLSPPLFFTLLAWGEILCSSTFLINWYLTDYWSHVLLTQWESKNTHKSPIDRSLIHLSLLRRQNSSADLKLPLPQTWLKRHRKDFKTLKICQGEKGWERKREREIDGRASASSFSLEKVNATQPQPRPALALAVGSAQRYC